MRSAPTSGHLQVAQNGAAFSQCSSPSVRSIALRHLRRARQSRRTRLTRLALWPRLRRPAARGRTALLHEDCAADRGGAVATERCSPAARSERALRSGFACASRSTRAVRERAADLLPRFTRRAYRVRDWKAPGWQTYQTRMYESTPMQRGQ
jgi:hypothetical protein